MADFVGEVAKNVVARGSKSEHAAVILRSGKQAYILRRRGGNGFVDPILDDLVGKTVKFQGIEHGGTLIVSDWRVLP